MTFLDFWINALFTLGAFITTFQSSEMKHTHIPPVQGSLNTKGMFRMLSGRQWPHPWSILLSTKANLWVLYVFNWKLKVKLFVYLIWEKRMTHTVCLSVIKLAYITFGITSAIIMWNVLNSHLLIQCIWSTQHWLCSVMHHIKWTWQQDGREREWDVCLHIKCIFVIPCVHVHRGQLMASM